MLNMTTFREGLFHQGAVQHLITLHICTRYKVPQITCLRLLCLMVGSVRYDRNGWRYEDMRLIRRKGWSILRMSSHLAM
jgi:hypothetical protein